MTILRKKEAEEPKVTENVHLEEPTRVFIYRYQYEVTENVRGFRNE